MTTNWVGRLMVPLGLALIMGLLRRYAPPPPAPPSTYCYDERQRAEPFAPGVISGFMWFVGLLLASTFFAFRYANHWWADLDGPTELKLYPGAAIWCFLPGFAAICIPWPFTVWLLRRLGRTDEADSITLESNRSGGMDSFRILKWFSFGVTVPIAFFTVLAIPMHLSLTANEITVGRYARLQSEHYPFSQLTRITLIDGYRYRDGTFHARKDMFLDFSDGRRLDANAAGDGGSAVPDEVIAFVTERTDLNPYHVRTRDELPKP